MPGKVILMEDNVSYRRDYIASLVLEGFDFEVLEDGVYLAGVLREYNKIDKKCDIVVSDSDMPWMKGYDAVRFCMERNLLDDNVLIIGMSDNPENIEGWRGIAHRGCFYDKNHFLSLSLGRIVSQSWKNFNSGIAGWRMRIPERF